MNTTTTKKIAVIASGVVALGIGATACGAASTGSHQSASAGLPASTTCRDAPEVTAARVEAALAPSAPGSTWTQGGGDLEGAYRQDSLAAPYETQSVIVSLYHTPGLANQAVPQIQNLGYYLAVYADDCTTVAVVNSAPSAVVAAVAANH